MQPENILLADKAAPDGGLAVKIIDFGLSNTFEQGSTLTTACGSPAYASPSMIMRVKGGYNPRKSDIWSLGVVLFAMVAGCLPFEHENTAALYDQILNARYRCPSHLSPACRDLLARILVVDPRRRFGAEEIRRHPWMRTASGNVAVVRSPITAADYVAAREAGDAAKARALLAMHNPRGIAEALPAVMRAAEGLGISMEQLQDSIRATAHNAATAAYHLLLRQALRRGDALSLLAGVGGGSSGSASRVVAADGGGGGGAAGAPRSATLGATGNDDLYSGRGEGRTRSRSPRPVSAHRSYMQRLGALSNAESATGRSGAAASQGRGGSHAGSGSGSGRADPLRPKTAASSFSPTGRGMPSETPSHAPEGGFASRRSPTVDPTRRVTSQARPRVPALALDQLRPTTTGVVRGRESFPTGPSPRRDGSRSPPQRRQGPAPAREADWEAGTGPQSSEAAWAAREAQFESYEERKQRIAGQPHRHQHQHQHAGTTTYVSTEDSRSIPLSPAGATRLQGGGPAEMVRPSRPASAMRPSTAQRRGGGAGRMGAAVAAQAHAPRQTGEREGFVATRHGTVIVTARGSGSGSGGASQPLSGGGSATGGSFTGRRVAPGPEAQRAAGSFGGRARGLGSGRGVAEGGAEATAAWAKHGGVRYRAAHGGGSGAGASLGGRNGPMGAGSEGSGLATRPNSARSVSSGQYERTGPLEHLSLLANRQRAGGPGSGSGSVGSGAGAAGGSARRVVPDRPHRGSATSGHRESFATASSDGSGGGGGGASGQGRRPSAGSSRLTLGRHGGYEYVQSSGYGSGSRRRQSGLRARSPRPGSGRRPQTSAYSQPPYHPAERTAVDAPSSRRQVGTLRTGGRLGASDQSRSRSVSPRASGDGRAPNAGQQARFRGAVMGRDAVQPSARHSHGSEERGGSSAGGGSTAHSRRQVDAAGLSPRAGMYAAGGTGGYGRRDQRMAAYGPATGTTATVVGAQPNAVLVPSSTSAGTPSASAGAAGVAAEAAAVFVPRAAAGPPVSAGGQSMVVQQASSGRVTFVYSRRRPASAARGRQDRSGSAAVPGSPPPARLPEVSLQAATTVGRPSSGRPASPGDRETFEGVQAGPVGSSNSSSVAVAAYAVTESPEESLRVPRLPAAPGVAAGSPASELGPDSGGGAGIGNPSRPTAPTMPRRPTAGAGSPQRGAAAARGRTMRLQVGASSSDTQVGPSVGGGNISTGDRPGDGERVAEAGMSGRGGEGVERFGGTRESTRSAWHGSSDASLADDEADDSQDRRDGRRLLRMAAEPIMGASEDRSPAVQPKPPCPPAASDGVVSASGGASTGSYTAIEWAMGRQSSSPPASTMSAQASTLRGSSQPPPPGAAAVSGKAESLAHSADAKEKPEHVVPTKPAYDSGAVLHGDGSSARRVVLARNSGGGTGATGVNP